MAAWPSFSFAPVSAFRGNGLSRNVGASSTYRFIRVIRDPSASIPTHVVLAIMSNLRFALNHSASWLFPVSYLAALHHFVFARLATII
jgi:hypothetical protein